MNKPETEHPSIEQIIAKAHILAEALPHLQKFRDSTVVIKYGGHAMLDPMLKKQVLQDIVMMESVGINPVIVHGGGPEITGLMKRMGMTPEFREGQRITDEATLEITEMVLAGKLNGEIVSLIHQAGGMAVGLSGKDARLVIARKLLDQSGRDLGFVGDVVSVNARILQILDQNHFIPVVSPIGADEAGQTYNINADFVAAEIAAAMGARKLVLLTDVLGIMRDPKDPSTLLQSIHESQVDQLFREGIITGGMIPKVQACLRALKGGVKMTHILDGRLQHSLLLELFTDAGIGTMIHARDESDEARN